VPNRPKEGWYVGRMEAHYTHGVILGL